jgi:hypothetical protein
MKDGDFVNAQWTKFLTSAYVDLPFAVAGRWFSGNAKPLNEAGWATYDSAVALANEAMNQLYSNRLVADVFGNTLETIFQMQYALEGPMIKASLNAADSRYESDSTASQAKPVESTTETRTASFATSSAAYRSTARKRRKAAA